MAMKLALVLALSTTVNIAEFKDRFTEFPALVEQGGEAVVKDDVLLDATTNTLTVTDSRLGATQRFYRVRRIPQREKP